MLYSNTAPLCMLLATGKIWGVRTHAPKNESNRIKGGGKIPFGITFGFLRFELK